MWPQHVGAPVRGKLERQTSSALCHLSDKEELGHPGLKDFFQHRPLACTEVRLGYEGCLRDTWETTGRELVFGITELEVPAASTEEREVAPGSISEPESEGYAEPEG